MFRHVKIRRAPKPRTVPVAGPLSIFDPVFFGIDEFGHAVHVPMMYRNILLGGEPGSGESVGLNNVVAHAALSAGLPAVPDRRQAGRAGPVRRVCGCVRRPGHRVG